MNFSEREKRERALKVYDILKKEFPDARCLLDYRNPFELLISTILAAQCTDARVNRVTPELFNVFPDLKRLAEADREKLESIIRPTGFFRNKAKSLINVSKVITDNYNGTLPGTVEELSSLPGVGRKTGNVVAANCFAMPAVIVDTHVKRVVTRLGFTKEKQPDKIERELKNLIPESEQTRFSYAVNFHGRNICRAAKPACGTCPVRNLCPFPEDTA